MSEAQPVIGLGFHSSATEVDHEALLVAFVNEISQPGIHAPNCSLTDCDGYLRDIIGGLTLALVPSVFFGGARRCVEGEGESCRPPSAPRTCPY